VRTPDSLRARARKLGLTPLRSGRSDQRPRPWTAGEDEQLRLRQGLNPGALAELLGRSPEAVTQRLRRLKLRDARQRSPHHPASVRGGFTPGERATLARELQTGGPRRELALARRLERTPAEIRAVASAGRRDAGPPPGAITPAGYASRRTHGNGTPGHASAYAAKTSVNTPSSPVNGSSECRPWR
jgi:hypothetical protein